MAEIEKVIKGLEECVSAGKCQDCIYGKEHPALSCKALLNDALELLKKQVPIAPIVNTNGYGVKFYYCPNCNIDFYCHSPWDNYCKNCGQAVKWE